MGAEITISYDAIFGILIMIVLALIGWIIYYIASTNNKYNKLKEDFSKIDKEFFGMRLNFESEISKLKDKISEINLKMFGGRSLPEKI